MRQLRVAGPVGARHGQVRGHALGLQPGLDVLRPVTVGERVGRRGQRLISCTPKQTSMGRGAFLTWESELVTEPGEVVARVRTGTYAYNPAGPEEEQP